MRKLLENQLYNLFLWTPLLMAGGAALYFALPIEPYFSYIKYIAIMVCVFIGLGILFFRLPVLLRGALLFVFGFAYAIAFTYILDTPGLKHSLHGADISATVTNIDYTTDKVRIFLQTTCDDINIARDCDATVRLTLEPELETPSIGDKINATVNLYHPSGADAPATFDYARWAYFNGLTATGVITDYAVVLHGTENTINKLRNYLHEKSNSFLIDTLVLGYKNAVSENDRAKWTATGIGHVWSISGFHIALVSGWLFAIFYAIFRLIAPITRRVPARIPAMMCAWFGLLFYVLLSGGDVATWRAFFMTSLVFGAFIIGRDAISLRNVCIAFCAVFFMCPHYVTQAGFQLSFAAVFGLVWIYEKYQNRKPRNKILRYVSGAIVTTVVATIFTAPFVMAHFYSLPLYGLIGNLLLLPIFSVAIMPLVLIGCMVAPMGLYAPVEYAHIIYEHCLGVADKIANLPHATIITPHIPNAALMCFVFGFAALMFIRPLKVKINYILCGLFIAVGITIITLRPRPAFFATADHELVGFVENGKLEFNKARASNHYFAFDTWKQFNGEETGTPNIRRQHNNGLYMFNTKNFRLAYVQKFVTLRDNLVTLCNDADLDYIVSYFDIDAPKCHAQILHNGFVIYESGHITYVPSHRPWHNQH